jgi:hypothetical protein
LRCSGSGIAKAGLAESIRCRCLGDMSFSPSRPRQKWTTRRASFLGSVSVLICSAMSRQSSFLRYRATGGPPLLERTKATLQAEIELSNTDHFGEERLDPVQTSPGTPFQGAGRGHSEEALCEVLLIPLLGGTTPSRAFFRFSSICIIDIGSQLPSRLVSLAPVIARI